MRKFIEYLIFLIGFPFIITGIVGVLYGFVNWDWVEAWSIFINPSLVSESQPLRLIWLAWFIIYTFFYKIFNQLS